MGIFDKVKKIAEAVQTASSNPDAANYGRFVVLDVETTGLDPEQHRVIEICLLNVENGVANDLWTTRFNPEGPVGKTEIHGITDQDVANSPLFREKLDEILEKIDGVLLVAHNARFDLAFLKAEIERTGKKAPWMPSICTLEASKYYQSHLSRRRLDDCCEDIGVEIENAHSAAGDAIATAKLFHYFMMPDKDPLPRKQDLELIKNPSSASRFQGDDFRRNPHVQAQIQKSQEQRERKASTSSIKELNKLLKACSLSEVITDLKFDGGIEYLEKVIEFLADGLISDTESKELTAMANIYSLTPSQVELAHKALLATLAVQALNDESISVTEREEITLAGQNLGLGASDVAEAIKRAKQIRIDALSKDLKALPEGWSLGEPLRVGDKVVFTGCDPTHRANLERDTLKLGVAISSKVSKKTKLLVTDGGFVGNKANDAAALGVRLVTPDDYEMLLKYVQPSEVKEADTSAQRKSSQSGAEGLDPSEVRAWALENGIEVSPKGRIHTDVYELFKNRKA
jgi:DNA polymerase-3 subunit epsilon